MNPSNSSPSPFLNFLRVSLSAELHISFVFFLSSSPPSRRFSEFFQLAAMEYGNSEHQDGLSQKYDCLLFDLDDTLYPLSSGLAPQVAKNIQEYMIEKLGIPQDKVTALCLSLYKYYGTTMAGLRAIGFKFDYDDCHSFIHGRLPYDTLKPDPVLKSLLNSLPIRKVIFTNADKAHAEKALSRLGLEDCFEQILCFESLNDSTKGNETVDEDSTEIFDINEYSASPNAGLSLPKTPVVCKPFDEAYEEVFKLASINPHRTVFFDDSLRNIQTGKRLGLHTVWVGTSSRTEGVDHALESIHNIKEALPELWDMAAMDKTEGLSYSTKVAIEAEVQA